MEDAASRAAVSILKVVAGHEFFPDDTGYFPFFAAATGRDMPFSKTSRAFSIKLSS